MNNVSIDKILHIDLRNGISGDMLLGALLDLDVDKEYILNQLKSLNLNNYELKISSKTINGIKATDIKVDVPKKEHIHRTLLDITELIQKSDLNENVKSLSINLFNTIAKAEAKVHGIDINKVHFHEVGAIDSIIDITATALAIDYLKPVSIYATPVLLGYGHVNCAHGKIPVPVPATLEILKGIEVFGSEFDREIVTPTGAAFIKVLVSDFIKMPSMKILGTGYGAADKSNSLLRVILGEKTDQCFSFDNKNKLVILETNIDDMSPEIHGYIMEKLIEHNCLDIWFTPIYMKKNRPAVKISILVEQEDVQQIEDILFMETTTLGIRRLNAERVCLKREIITVKTEYGDAKIKVAKKDNTVVGIYPEYEDCKKLAKLSSKPIKEIYILLQTLFSSTEIK